MVEKRFTVRMVSDRGQQVRQEFDAITGRARTAYQEITQGAKSAERSAAVFEAELRDQAAAFDRLRASLDPAHAAQRRFEAAVDQARLAVRAGVVTQEEANRVMMQAQAMHLGVGDAATVSARAAGANSFAMRNMAMQLSQIASQGAVTGNYLQAMAIQLPDLALGFGTVGIVVGALAGSLAMALLPRLTGTGDSAKALSDQIGGLSSTLQSYRADIELASRSTAQLREEFGELGRVVAEQALFNAQNQIGGMKAEMQAFSDDIDATIGKVTQLGRDAFQAFEQIQNAGPNTDVGFLVAQLEEFQTLQEEAAEAIGLTVAETNQLNDAWQEFTAAETLDEMVTSTGEVLELMRALYGTGEQVPEALRPAVSVMTDLFQELVRAQRATEFLEDAANGIPPPLDASAGAASTLAGSLNVATGAAGALVATLGQVPAAIAGMAGDVDRAVAALESQNESLRSRVLMGSETMTEQIREMRDEAVQLTAARTGSIDAAARVGVAYDEQASRAQSLREANSALTEQLSQMNRVATGGTGGSSGGSRGGAAGAMDALAEANETAWYRITDTTKALMDQAAALNSVNDQAGTSALDGLLKGAGSGDIMSGVSGFLGKARSSFMDGPMMSGLASRLGSALGPLMPAIGGISTVMQIFDGFSSREKVGEETQRLGVLGMGGGVFEKTVEEFKETSFWGLKSSTDIKTSFRSLNEETRQAREAFGQLIREVRQTGGPLGVMADRFRDIKVPIVDGDIAGALTRADDAIAGMIPGITRLQGAGETVAETLGRLSTALATYNESARVMRLPGLPNTVGGAGRAAEILGRVDLAGAGAAFTSTLGEGERMAILRGQINRQAAQFKLPGQSIRSNEDLQALVGKLSADGRAMATAGAISLAPLVAELDALKASVRDTQRATRDAAAAAREQAEAQRLAAEEMRADALTRQRIQILGLQDRESEARRLELSLMEPYLRAGLEQIWQLQDAAEAEWKLSQARNEATRAAEEARRAINAEDFSTAWEFKAARQRAGRGVHEPVADMGAPAPGAQQRREEAAAKAEAKLSEVLEKLGHMNVNLISIERSTRKSRELLEDIEENTA